MAKGFIYIMTNPALHNMVKIGYSKDVEKRRKDLSTTALPFEYEVFATYETEGKLEDKILHKLIDKLNPDLKVSKNREFYMMTPEDAYELLEAIAIISNTKEKLEPSTIENCGGVKELRKIPKSPINFVKCGIPIGSELSFIEDENIKVKVISERKVEYNGEEFSLSTLAQELKYLKAKPQGTAFFMYNGRPLIDIANETQWK